MLTTRFHFAGISCFLAATAVSAPAAADNGFFAEIGGGAAYVDLPKVNGFATVIDDGPYVFIRQSDEQQDIRGVGPAGHLLLGVDLRGRSESALLKNSRIKIQGRYSRVNDDFGRTIVLSPGQFLDILPINGNPARGGVGSVDINLVGNADATFWDVTWSLETFTHLGDKTALVSWEAGVTYAQLDQKWNVSHLQAGGGLENFLSENVDAFYVGPIVGVAASKEFSERLRGRLNVNVAGLYTEADLAADQIINGSGFIIPGGSAEYVVSNTDNNWGARVGAGAEIAFAVTDALTLSLNGNVEWWQQVAQIVNPRSAAGIDADASTFTPAHLEQESALMATATARLGYTF